VRSETNDLDGLPPQFHCFDVAQHHFDMPKTQAKEKNLALEKLRAFWTPSDSEEKCQVMGKNLMLANDQTVRVTPMVSYDRVLGRL
jgi:hypothetical protein